MPEPFDFNAFMNAVSNPDDDTRKLLEDDELQDATSLAMAEIGPRIWCILQDYCLKDKTNQVRQNAALNALLFSTMAWVAASVNPDEIIDGEPATDVLRRHLDQTFDNALQQVAEQPDFAASIARAGYNVGKLKLLEDACASLGNVLVTNSLVIKGAVEVFQGLKK